MTAPAWLVVVLAATMLLIAAGSALRLVLWRLRGLAAEAEEDALHVLMGVAMAGMLEPRLSPVPDEAWRVVFAAAAVWFGWRAVRTRTRGHDGGSARSHPGSWRCAYPGPHVVECSAMVYMLVAARAGADGQGMAMRGMTGAAPAANPAVAIVLALLMVGSIVWTADRVMGHPAGAALSSRATACSGIAMGLAMGYMLLTMV